MAAQGAVVNTSEVKTGRGFGPVGMAITLSQAIVGLAFILLSDIWGITPSEGAEMFTHVIVASAVGYFTKGRAYVEEKTVFEQSSIGVPVGYEETPAYDTGVTPIPDGTGEHRLETN